MAHKKMIMIGICLTSFLAQTIIGTNQYTVQFINKTNQPLFIKYDHRPQVKPGQRTTMEIIPVHLPEIAANKFYTVYINNSRRISDVHAAPEAAGPYKSLGLSISGNSTYEITQGHNGFVARKVEQ